MRNNSINYKGLIIKIISLKQIEERGYDLFRSILYPIMLPPNHFKESVVNVLEGILKDESLAKNLSFILGMATNCDSIKLYRNRVGLIFKEDDKENEFIIDSGNYEDIFDIILKMNGQNKIKPEPEPPKLGARGKAVWDIIKAGRKEHDEKNKLNLYDVLSVCEFGGNYHISMNEISEWSLWKVLHCYKIRIGWKSYDDGLSIALVGGKSDNISGNNQWYKQLMVH